MNSKRIFSAALSIATALSLAGAAAAQNKVTLGTLTCSGGAGPGLILGSKKSYRCRFEPSNAGGTETYTATVTKIGLDVGVTGKSVMIWTVLASSGKTRRGMLAGNYAGAAADVAIGIGGGAKVLVGGSKKSVILQPLSVQGQSGMNLAIGVANMTLR